jgi:hypothetical protein
MKNWLDKEHPTWEIFLWVFAILIGIIITSFLIFE